MMDSPTFIDTGDTVVHLPSGEHWLVAYVSDNRKLIAWCGWPSGMTKIDDVILERKATPEERVALLMDMANMSVGDDHRKLYAMRTLKKENLLS